jgi:hypothetical protein
MGWMLLLVERPAGLEPANLRLGKATLCQLSYDRVLSFVHSQVRGPRGVVFDRATPLWSVGGRKWCRTTGLLRVRQALSR